MPCAGRTGQMGGVQAAVARRPAARWCIPRRRLWPTNTLRAEEGPKTSSCQPTWPCFPHLPKLFPSMQRSWSHCPGRPRAPRCPTATRSRALSPVAWRHTVRPAAVSTVTRWPSRSAAFPTCTAVCRRPQDVTDPVGLVRPSDKPLRQANHGQGDLDQATLVHDVQLLVDDDRLCIPVLLDLAPAPERSLISVPVSTSRTCNRPSSSSMRRLCVLRRERPTGRETGEAE